jgi:hypothetical protein
VLQVSLSCLEDRAIHAELSLEEGRSWSPHRPGVIHPAAAAGRVLSSVESAHRIAQLPVLRELTPSRRLPAAFPNAHFLPLDVSIRGLSRPERAMRVLFTRCAAPHRGHAAQVRREETTSWSSWQRLAPTRPPCPSVPPRQRADACVSPRLGGRIRGTRSGYVPPSFGSSITTRQRSLGPQSSRSGSLRRRDLERQTARGEHDVEQMAGDRWRLAALSLIKPRHSPSRIATTPPFTPQ